MGHEVLDRSLPLAVVLNGILASMIGALLGGLRGLQIGCLTGVVLALLPLAAMAARLYLFRPDCLVRFAARELGAAAGRLLAQAAEAVAGIAAKVGEAVSPVSRTLRRPLLIAKLLASVAWACTAAFLSRCLSAFLTPLGLANIAALAILAAAAKGLDGAWLAVFAGFPALVVVLLVSAHEAAED